ncbi:MAG TPA: hypothetical protein PK048_02890 [Candidatus Absconditabacterales bacterium]|nr:hypothetical protein [Candidatus Absconditabacterales bacterium]
MNSITRYLFLGITILFLGCSYSNASLDSPFSLTASGVTVTYYQSGIIDSHNVYIPYKNGYDFLQSTQEGIKVTTKGKIKFFYTPFSIYNREVAKRAGSGNIVVTFSGFDTSGKKRINTDNMFSQMIGFKGFIGFSPRLRYITYEIDSFELYDARKFVMMDIRNGETVLERKTNNSNCLQGNRQPDGARFFYTISYNFHQNSSTDVIYTSAKNFPRSIKLFSVTTNGTQGVASINFSKQLLIIKEGYNGMDGICSRKKYRYHIYRLSELE